MPAIDENDVLHLLGEEIVPGQKKIIDFNTAKLYTTTVVKVPVIVERAKKPGPVILITSGIHGDELNGVEIVRQLIARKINKPKRGTVICIPIVNVFGFLNMQREFPDGRDLNRMFPGSKNGALASRFAYQFMHEILPVADLCLDFHTGGAQRFNAAQIRLKRNSAEGLKYAKIFNAPFTVYSKLISKSYRGACAKNGTPILLFEGGKSQDSDKGIAEAGVKGAVRILKHLDMLRKGFVVEKPEIKTIFIEKSRWIRASYSGLLHNKIPIGKYVKKGEYIATITDPYGSFRHKVKAPNDGYIINVNQSPIVYQGDAIYHISQESGK